MKIVILTMAAAFAAATSVPAWSQAKPMSPEECTALWTKIDANADAKYDATEVKPYVDALTAANVTPKDAGMLSPEEFMDNCAKGTFSSVAAPAQ